MKLENYFSTTLQDECIEKRDNCQKGVIKTGN